MTKKELQHDLQDLEPCTEKDVIEIMRVCDENPGVWGTIGVPRMAADWFRFQDLMEAAVAVSDCSETEDGVTCVVNWMAMKELLKALEALEIKSS